MKSILINEPGTVSVTEKERPEIKAGEVLVKLKYVGFCGSDLSTYLGKNPMVQIRVYPDMKTQELLKR